jgi:hypothetical protein
MCLIASWTLRVSRFCLSSSLFMGLLVSIVLIRFHWNVPKVRSPSKLLRFIMINTKWRDHSGTLPYREGSDWLLSAFSGHAWGWGDVHCVLGTIYIVGWLCKIWANAWEGLMIVLQGLNDLVFLWQRLDDTWFPIHWLPLWVHGSLILSRWERDVVSTSTLLTNILLLQIYLESVCCVVTMAPRWLATDHLPRAFLFGFSLYHWEIVRMLLAAATSPQWRENLLLLESYWLMVFHQLLSVF